MPYAFSREEANTAIKNVRNLIQKYFKENGLTYAVFGKSEGLDSSVIAGLLGDIEGIKPIGVIMPCESDLETERIARVVLDHFKIPWIKVDLTKEYHYLMGHYYSSEGIHGQLSHILKHYNDPHLLKDLPHKKSKAAGNIKVRLRMVTLYHIAQLTGGLVVSTDNLSELWMGFWTLNGDVGDLSPIQYVWKGLEEYTIAEALGVPKDSIDAVPTDGLDVLPGGTDEDQLGLPYQDLDKVIVALLQNNFNGNGKWDGDRVAAMSEQIAAQLGYSPAKISHVARQMKNTHFKRNWPKAFKRSEIGLQEVDNIKL
ncbi:MAG: NAD(+) synthase [Nitrospirae bacterium]|nr:NAD(+) synthase [Nitrospirota bacterium]